MTQHPEETPTQAALQAQFSAYGGGDISVQGAQANLGLRNEFSYQVYGRMSAAEGTDATLAFGAALGEFVARKAIGELYENHGIAVSHLMGEEQYQAALLEKAQYETMPAREKAGQPTPPAVRNYSYFSTIAHTYANGFNPLGVYGVGPLEVRSIGLTGGDLRDPDFFERLSVTILSADDEGIHIASAPLEIPHDDDSMHFLTRLALEGTLPPEQEAAHDQPALDLMRLQLAVSERKRMYGVVAFDEAHRLYGQQIFRLEYLKQQTPLEAQTSINDAFVVQGFGDILLDNPEQ